MSCTDSSSMVARQGREKQLYSASGARVVAGTVILSSEKDQVLLVSSESVPNKWVLPKGGVEQDESLEQSALRETWEEAGAIGRIGVFIGRFFDERPNPQKSTEFYFYELQLERLADEWPEGHKRKRKWFHYNAAKEALLDNKRKQLAEALDSSTISKGL